MNSPTRPITWAEFNSKPAGVSSSVTFGDGGSRCISQSKAFRPLGEVSPEPNKTIGPG
jgi:hypothetical protein